MAVLASLQSSGAKKPSWSASVPTCHVRAAADGSTCPARSIARAWKVCVPSPTVKLVTAGQAANGDPSSEHSNEAPGSDAASVNAGVWSVVSTPLAGPALIEVSGAPVSTVQAHVAASPVNWGPSIAAVESGRTLKLCGPSPRPLRSAAAPPEQGANAPPSNAHWKLTGR